MKLLWLLMIHLSFRVLALVAANNVAAAAGTDAQTKYLRKSISF